MTLTEPERLACIEYVMRRSWRVRLTPQRSRRLIRHCLDRMPTWAREDWQRPETPRGNSARYWLFDTLAAEAWLQTKSSAVLWLILRFVLPVLIRLVVEWWLSRQRSEG